MDEGLASLSGTSRRAPALIGSVVAGGADLAATPESHGGVSRSWHDGLELHRRDGIPVDLSRIHVRPIHKGAKRALDLVVGLALAVVLSPVLVMLALAVKFTSKGPVLFVQEREGESGRLFRIYKFRSLYIESGDPTGVAQVGANDARVTPAGRLLRRTSLDELPQLLNIIKGEMSLVGPRPHVPHMQAGGKRYDRLVPYYHLRHLAKPGLTGWAQAHGLRGPTGDPATAHARIDHDIAYIANFSFWLDLRILWLTAWRELARFGRGI